MDDESDASVGQAGFRGSDSDVEVEHKPPVSRQYTFSDGSDDDSDCNNNNNSSNRHKARLSTAKSETPSASGDEEDDFRPRGKSKPKLHDKVEEDSQLSTPVERIPPIVNINGFRFQRCLKKRQKPKGQGKGFDVEYKLMGSDDQRIFRCKSHVETFCQKEGVGADYSLFDFSQKYDENGELTDVGRFGKDTGKGNKGGAIKKKRKARELLEPRSQKKPKIAPITDGHPISRALQILREVMTRREAPPFNEPVDLSSWPQYLEAVEEPMDLGTVHEQVCAGMFQTAHQVRRACSLVWRNCALFNGEDAAITKDVRRLAKAFDDKFLEQVPAPTHMGMRAFADGPQWVGHKVTVYFDDHRWYAGEIVEYDETKDEKYKIKYEEDDNCEWVSMPSIDITITDAWDGLAEPIEPWQGVPPDQMLSPVAGQHRPQRSRMSTKQFNPSDAAASKNRKKHDAAGALAAGANPDTPEKERVEMPTGLVAEPRADGEQRPEDFFCEDGAPCGAVCRCRLLFWCRFKTRKGVILGTTRGKTGVGMKQERCSYYLCPHPTVSSNDRWHYISPSTASGGRDWSELLGQTLCSSCFQQFRSKGTLLRVRDLPTG